MIRAATSEDAGAIDAFLEPQTATSMFLRGNLAAHGIGQSDHDHATDFFVWPDSGAIRAVFGVSRGGFLMAQAGAAPPAAFRAFARELGSRPILGMTGLAPQVAATLRATGLQDGPFGLCHDEPLMQRDLGALDAHGVTLRPADPSDRGILGTWIAAYMTETGVAAPAQAPAEAARRAEDATRGGSLRLMIEDGAPTAMAALNARVCDHVQVGGVFVPTDLRNAGRGRRVTAALLAEARRHGARVAILFANGPAAEAAYRAIGFERIGTYRVAVLAEPRAARPRS